MSGFQPKRYQQSVLYSLEAYFRACRQTVGWVERIETHRVIEALE